MTRAQWRIIATVCEALLDLDVARNCGVVTGGPAVDVAHCRWIIECARVHGVVTTAAAVDAVTRQLVVACGGTE